MKEVRYLRHYAIAILFGLSLLCARQAIALDILTPICRDENGNWLPEGVPCGPKGFTCQRLGDGPAMSCRRGATR